MEFDKLVNNLDSFDAVNDFMHRLIALLHGLVNEKIPFTTDEDDVKIYESGIKFYRSGLTLEQANCKASDFYKKAMDAMQISPIYELRILSRGASFSVYDIQTYPIEYAVVAVIAILNASIEDGFKIPVRSILPYDKKCNEKETVYEKLAYYAPERLKTKFIELRRELDK